VPPATRPCPLPAADPFCPLNDAFRDAYAAHRADVLAASGPVILYAGGDRLVLQRGRDRLEAPATSARYHELKIVAHAVLAVFLLLAPVDGPIDAARAAKLDSYRTHLGRAAATIEGRLAGGPQRDRQRRILGRAQSLLERALGERRLDAGALGDFVRAERADVLDNVKDAAREQVAAIHAAVQGWTAAMSPAERSRLRIVVGTTHMARPGNLAVQYFQAFLGEPYAGRQADERVDEGERVLVAEGTFDAERLLALVGTHLVDRAAAAAFFADPLRLDRDLLSDGAEEAIREVLGRVPP
jgi:hypothetical protein